MYINNFVCCLDKREENKCGGRIFRPWDNISEEKSYVKHIAQDNTISTTTEDEEIDIEIKIEDDAEYKTNDNFTKIKTTKKAKQCNEKTTSFIPTHKERQRQSLISKAHLEYPSEITSPIVSTCIPNTILPPPPMDYMSEVYNPMYPEVIQTNLAQSLGLPPNDPLLMESLAQGYALEEYARVLNQDHQAKVLSAKKQRPKKYKCPHCDVGFSNNGQLKGHIRIHTGERPFKCEEKECGKTFTRNEELTRHKRIHSGLRPFPCSHCGKRFGRKDHLKKHSRTHFQPRGVYAVPVMLPFEAWASGSINGYPFIPMY